MAKESVIAQLIRENRLNNVSNTLQLVDDALGLFENILACASEYFEELDNFYDEIMKLKYIGKAPKAYANISNNGLKMIILSKKRDSLDSHLSRDKDLRDATIRINQFLKKNKVFETLGLKVSYGEMNGKTVLFNYYKLTEVKKELERRSSMYKR